MFRRHAPAQRLRPALAALALFIALAVLHTWPLAAGLGSWSRHEIADAALNEWILAWTAHQLIADPANLFHANIFYPEPNTLAFSEHLFLQSLLGAPLLWSGVSTLVVHNVVLIAGLALSGWTMALVVRNWTDDWWAAVLAGMLFAFNGHTLTRLAHIQALHIEFLPLAMLALDRLLTQPRAATAVWLALAFVLQSLASNYLLVFMAFGLVAAALARPREWLTPGRGRTFALLSLAAAVAVLLLAPFLVPYLQAQRDQGLSRSLDEVAIYAASWRDYLAAGGRVHHGTWSAPFARPVGAFLFPGVTALLLTAVAVATGAARRPVPRMWIALGVAGLVLSFGTLIPGYEWLYRGVPLLQGIRASVRFGFLTLAAVAVLAAFGLVALRRRLNQPRLRTFISLAALALVTVEAARLPLEYTAPYHAPAAYKYLRDAAGGVLVELPLYSPTRIERNVRYMLNSTRHWRPIVNGYSGFMPSSYITHEQALASFPDPTALDYLRRLRVTHVAVHHAEFRASWGEERYQSIAGTPGLTRLLVDGNLAIYKLDSTVTGRGGVRQAR